MKNQTSYLIVALMALLILSCKKEKVHPEILDANSSEPMTALTPPVAGIDVPFIELQINTAKDTLVVLKSGTHIKIPKNTFVDENNQPISNTVSIQFREFKDAIDIWASGIPMTYEKNGQSYLFESAAMCELKATDPRIKIDKDKTIGIALASKIENTENYDLYQLNETKTQWSDIGKDTLIQMPKSVNQPKTRRKLISEPFTTTETIDGPIIKPLEKPIKPAKQTNSDIYFNVVLKGATKNLEEFAIFKDVNFKLIDKTTFNEADVQHKWTDVKVKRIPNKDHYQLTFISNTQQTSTTIKQSYFVIPCYKGEKYNEAIKDYEKRYAAYEKRLKEIKIRKAREEAAFLKQQEEWKRLQEEANEEDKKLYRMMENNTTVRRYFSVNEFGIFNVDRFYNSQDETITITGRISNKNLKLTYLQMIDATRNRVLRKMDYENLRVYKNAVVHLIGLNQDGQLCVLKNLDTKNYQDNNTLAPLSFKVFTEQIPLEKLKTYLKQ